MPKERELRDAASAYTWLEILDGTNFICIGERSFPEGTGYKWILEGYENNGCFLTTDSDSAMFQYDSEGNLRATISKFDFLRAVKFDGNHRATTRHVESGMPLIRSLLPEIRDHYRTEFEMAHGDLPVKERKYFDPLLGQAVMENVRGREASEEGKRIYEMASHKSDRPTPKGMSLADFIQKPLNSQRWLIDGVIPVGGNVSVVAAMKTGKSTLVYNFIYSLVFSELFLGKFKTHPFEGRIGFVNFELTEEQCQEWFQKSPIGASDRVHVWNLRGEPNPFRSGLACQDFAREVNEQDIRVLILDPWSSLFVGDTNNNDEVKKFWLALDEFKTNSGVKELIIPIHAGRDITKSRGASTLDDHPDSIIHLTRQSDGIRTLRAIGRDVDIPEGELSFDSSTLLLTYKGAVTPESKDERTTKIIRRLFEKTVELSATDLYRLSGKGKSDIQAARQMMVRRGELNEKQVGQTKFYSMNPKYISPLLTTSRETPRNGIDSGSSAISREPESQPEEPEPASACNPCEEDKIRQFKMLGLEIRMCDDCDYIHDVWTDSTQIEESL
jgi:hypothetical protein